MGFPVGYSELFIPKLLLHAAFTLVLLRRTLNWFLQSIGLAGIFLFDLPDYPSQSSWPDCPDHTPEFSSVTAALIRDLLPIVPFSEVSTDDAETDPACAVCLYEFEANDEIRRLTNCRHIFHRSCLDRWMDHDQRTCPLCRASFVPEETLEAINDRIWAAAAAMPDFYGEYSSPLSSSP